MTHKKVICAILCLYCALNSYRLYAQLKLPALVRDSMVVQRDTKLKIWGWASPGEKITIVFNGQRAKATTNKDGKWFAWLLPMKTGGPYKMDIVGTNKITLNNILIGDVWICSGQSNMVHQMKLHKEMYESEIARANYPEIRHFFIPTVASLRGIVEDIPRGFWKSANPKDVLGFSAVAFFFAKNIYEKYHVPIGLINASWGGTPIEAWISEDGLREFSAISNTVQKNKDTAYVNSTNRAAVANNVGNKQKRGDAGLTGPRFWYDTAFVPKKWRTIAVPGYWEDQGIKDLNGVVWYRREIDVPSSMTGVPAMIALGRIVDADFLYVNGVLVGSTSYQYPQRRYPLPAGLLKPGKNVLVVRVLNTVGKGGFVPDKPYYIKAGEQTIDLKGYWQYKVGEVYTPIENTRGGISVQNQPTALFNAMIAPIVNYSIKGILWYQGESNTGRAEEYSKLLPALIVDWRNQWRLGDIPFLYAQLPNFMDVNYSPSESQWAQLREAQLKALSIPKTGMAVTIDLGEWNDIHPDNKRDVGDRLALAAQKVAYADNNVVYSGPVYQSFKIEGNKIIVSFTNVGSGLASLDGENLSQFSIAGTDKKFVWAKAEISGNTVVIWNDAVPDPMYVRYAWSDNPDNPNFGNKEGLPASPFRTDGY